MLNFLVIFMVAMRCLVAEETEGCIGKCLQTTESDIINYLPHTNCNNYCVCVAGQPEIMPCKPDEHWSSELEMCTVPAEARCQAKNVNLGCVVDCPNSNIFVGHHICSKYCECKGSVATVEDCDPGTYFSTPEQKCVSWDSSDCELMKPSTAPPTRPPTSPSTRPPTSPSTRPPTSPSTRPPTIKPPPVDVSGCIGTCPLCNLPDKTYQLPHQDPTKFCKCNWGKPVVFTCLDDLLYNEKEEVCGGTDCSRYKS